MATQFSGGTIVNTTFPGQYKVKIMMGFLANLPTAGWTLQQLGIGTATTLGYGNASTVTLTLASPGVVTWASHGFLGGEQIMFQNDTINGATLPSGLAVNTWYYVNYIDSSTFYVSATLGGSNINFTGSQSGTIWCYTSFILFQSGTQTSVTNPIVVRVQDNAMTAVNFTIQNSTGTLSGPNGTIQGSGVGRYYGAGLMPFTWTNYQLIATRFQFFCFTVGQQSYNRAYVQAGMLYVPSFLTVPIAVTDVGYVLGDCFDSEDGFYGNCFRNMPQLGINNTPNFQVLWNENVCHAENQPGGQSYQGWINAIILQPSSPQQSQTHNRWQNDYYNTSDVLFSCGLNRIDMEGKIKGQFYDMIYIPEAFMLDAQDTFNGHTWQNITNNNQGSPRGGMWVAIN